ncbi:MAG: hypothetical protein IKC09_03460 [Oscillospiraceae bacterium]|nr:hypothetical protein [Oscillospiraceae bacterium]
MKREDLFLAIGQVEESRLARSEGELPSNATNLEGPMNQQENRKSASRLLRNLLVAAVVMVLMATTVLAGTAYREVFGDVTDTAYMYTPTDAAGTSHGFASQKITLDIEMNPDAPRIIETWYVPELPEEYGLYFGNAYDGMEQDGRYGVLTLGWDAPGGEVQEIMFYQVTREGYERSYRYAHANGPSEFGPATLGGVDGYLILSPEDTDYGRKYFYWSDGDYLFYLRFDYSVPEDVMEQIIASVHQVESIDPYLISKP